MGRFATLAFVCALGVLGCRGHRAEPPPPECWDEDGDGYGGGQACLGFDCAEGDPTSHACDCSGSGESFGCPCHAVEPVLCFDGPSELLGVGACAFGMRRCESGFWSRCDGQVLPQDETCDEQDNDCDGEVDEDLAHECSDCTSGCAMLGFGAGRTPFVTEGPGLTVTPDGALALTGASLAPRRAWIPNTLEGTISKVDTELRQELGRYRTGPLGPSSIYSAGEGDVPSAVAVGPTGDAIVANRAPLAAPSVTRIRNDACPPGADGVLATSSGNDVLPWGETGPEDECVAWHTEVGGDNAVGRAVVLELRHELDGALHELVWLAAGRRLFELDGETGALTGTVIELDRAPTSAAIDPDGWIWLAEAGGRDLLRADPVSLDSEPLALPAGETAHDVAIDSRGDVWTAGSHVLRYRQSTTDWEVATDSGPSSGTIVADGSGVAWTLDDTGAVQRVAELGGLLVTDVIATGIGGTGLAVDHDRTLWAIGLRDEGLVTLLDPDRVGQITGTCCDFLRSSYARGDLTGAPRFAGLGPVTWSGRIDEPARDCAISWRQLALTGTVGDGVGVVAEVRAGATPEALDAAPWLDVAHVPPDALPVDVGPTLEAAGQGGRMLDVRLTIDPVDRDELPVIDSVTVERIEFCL